MNEASQKIDALLQAWRIDSTCPSYKDLLDLKTLIEAPIPLILHCPSCGLQHIDRADPPSLMAVAGGDWPGRWKNEPHRSHLCAGCGWQWRPADVATTGVLNISTRGKLDGPFDRLHAPVMKSAVAKLMANIERMRDLLDRRPALNAGLDDAYCRWTSLVYQSDAAFARSHIPPGPGTPDSGRYK